MIRKTGSFRINGHNFPKFEKIGVKEWRLSLKLLTFWIKLSQLSELGPLGEKPMLRNCHICPRLFANLHANSLLKHGLTYFNQFFYILQQVSSLCMDEWIPHEWSQTCYSSFSNSLLQWSHIVSLVQEWTTNKWLVPKSNYGTKIVESLCLDTFVDQYPFPWSPLLVWVSLLSILIWNGC